MVGTAYLTSSEAQQIRLAKRNVSHATYKMLFETAIQRIKKNAETDATEILYKIPHFMLGRPTINVKHAARYVSEKLKIYGYTTRYYEQDGTYFVYISWRATPVPIEKKPREVKRPKPTNTNIKMDTGDAVRRMEIIKLALQNSMGKKK
ncbi:hypothetical protein PBCVAN69C_629L [Paramecium bursaria Chlorella virus AN69C]|uniref:Uncharacterized protein n=1 Tax=Paramecium bursaria Chlorella virus IL3A TaxID=46019 RepID=M1HUV5_PBCVI|nr:hypothetical protein PBCVAN69C_629L [Paramecium bursaria Chlorella virus AN69C]AGE51595.1 hypothetical protein PBCVCviKI_532R [Paramecium bursaria Chlorella virus CviKI]AGE52612.1 hypothetical protein PBCVCvsA1_549R [Paramecium bursaria Chlorella virus CvsA1]AGE53964.1 hypothetical protein PBCVIL3A_543R [Paramecium bursaria Chlorella virus IL3A]AGE54657.1 hypothetical protein PBCVKS1B_471R [Paramecium bursaria Chlorella virus KS1B]AGE55406.1 hypothetical protein PBCVMA1E_640R [Paramecium bu